MTHKTIKKATDDLERFHFNTMLASLMEFTNYLAKVWEARSVDVLSWQEAIDTLLLLLAPTAPHLTEELWMRTGHPYSIHNKSFPVWEEDLVVDEKVTLVIQVNGKLRDKVLVPADIGEMEARELALSQPKVKAHLEGREVAKVIYVPQGLVNLVVR
jgi:leucyl-tRNA synthetase